MDNILFISLSRLKITSLAGLGPKNQIISISNLSKLKNISSLKESTIINIINCPLISKSLHSSLMSVKELNLRKYKSIELSEITLLKKLQNLKRLKVLKLHLPSSSRKGKYFYNAIKSVIFHLHHVEKFVLSGNLFIDYVGDDFNEEFWVARTKSNLFDEVILLRNMK